MNKPEYTISIQPGYVLVEDPPGYEVIWAEQSDKLKAIAATCSESGHRKVLIRGSKTNVRLTEMEIFTYGEEVAKLHLMLAIVSLHNATKEDVSYFENVATNRGSPVRFFDNEEDAKEWLGV